MVNGEIVSWIQAAEGLGYEQHQLRDLLVKNGFQQTEIDIALQKNKAMHEVPAIFKTHHAHRKAVHVGIGVFLAVAAFSGFMLITSLI